MTGYEVVPAALKKMVLELEDAAERWAGLADDIDGWVMNRWDLGPIGLLSEYPERYDEAAGKFADKIAEGARRLDKVAPTLKKVADYYAAKEAKYYRKFGYVGSELEQH